VSAGHYIYVREDINKVNCDIIPNESSYSGLPVKLRKIWD